MEMSADAVDEFAQISWAQEVRRAAAQMQLHHIPVAIEQPADFLDLAYEALHVSTASGEIPGDDPVAATVEAGAEAIGNVHVQR
jgi:hypothetical protein